MPKIPGYQINEDIYESDSSRIYRGRREKDGRPVILKMLNQEYPSPERIAHFKREYEITTSLDLPGVVKAYSLEHYQNNFVIILEDFGGQTLSQFSQANKITLPEFFTLAIWITDTLGQIHQQNIIHKDINPSNIVVVPPPSILDLEDQSKIQSLPSNEVKGLKSKIQGWQAKITDFGISTVLSRESPSFSNPNVLEGTLAYISPEQTGRMNRDIDYRTDFYSLGATFYELLAGQPPFPAIDAMELVHSHIAKQPPPPHILNPEIPPALSAIILKLLAKTAEARYQSAAGLKADLEECSRQWQQTGRVESFELGRHDISDRFQIPQKLYGRETEIESLLTTFERIAPDDQSKIQSLPSNEVKGRKSKIEVMLVTGYAGIGKSVLVNEIHKPITERRGYFIVGEFDQFQRDIPYRAIIQAFQDLIRQLLTENDHQIAVWKEKLLAALGPNGQVIVDVIPAVALIIGPQPPIPELGLAEAQNRFRLVFQNFIRVFGQAEHPLVIFLDGLQWADIPSLTLIQLFMSDVNTKHIFIIGAYSDNEVGPAHPLASTLAEMEKAGHRLNTITLRPLELPHISQLISDTLACSLDQAEPLAVLSLAKTGGNPFFLNQFLQSLYQEQLITFAAPQGRWQWNTAKIQALGITDNVVELMTGKLKRLPLAVQQVLKLAACIGHQFDLKTLAIIHESSPAKTATELWPALEEGLVLPIGDAYKTVQTGGRSSEAVIYQFLHGKVQQAAYTLIDDDQKKELHLRIGRLLLASVNKNERAERIFDIINQLNLGRELIDSQAERDKLVELNLLAGQKAKAAAAYQPALNYLLVGIELLAAPQLAPDGEISWHREYDLTLTLYTEAVEAACLSTDFEQMEHLAAIVLARAVEPLDKVKVYEARIQAYIAQNKLLEGIQTGLDILKLLGVRFPNKPNKLNIVLALIKTKLILLGKDNEYLLNLPEMVDPYKLAMMRILSRLSSAAYAAAPELMPLIIFKQVNLSVTYGNTLLSASAYAAYGLILCGAMGEIEAGYQFGELALNLLDRLKAREFASFTLQVVNSFIRHWKEHIQETLPSLLEAYQSALETGDLEIAAFSALLYTFQAWLIGKELVELEREMIKYSKAVEQLKQETALNYHKIYHQAVLNMLGQAENPRRLIGESYDEEKMLPLHIEANDTNAIYNVYSTKFFLCYLFHAYPQALKNATLAEPYLESVVGSPDAPFFYFYDSLLRIALFPNTPKAEQKRLLKKVAANQKKMKKWARHAPMNYRHKFYLVEAERARVLGHPGRAREYYDQAIALAQENEYVNEQALAYELAGRFYLAKEQSHLTNYYLRGAHYAYGRWGALAKVEDLETRYPEIFAHAEARSATTTFMTTTSGKSTSGTLDVTSVIKASQAISGEIVLDKLLTTLMDIVIENAGAQKGYLVLKRNGEWSVESTGAVNRDDVAVLQSVPLTVVIQGRNPLLPPTIINYVTRTGENIVLNNAVREGMFSSDPYVLQHRSKSILCMAIVKQTQLIGLLYLENNLTPNAFTPDRIKVLELLASQGSISLENAILYDDLKQAEAEVRRSEEYFRALIENTSDVITILDGAGGIRYGSPSIRRVLGYDPLELIGQSVFELIHPDDRVGVAEALSSITPDDTGATELRVRHKDGRWRDLEAIGNNQLDNPSVLGIVINARDITERKQAEKERVQLLAIQRELDVARDIQASLLPSSHPNWPGLDVICYSAAAREVGGDFYAYHAFTQVEGKDFSFAVVVGDVSGKGMPAALLMSVSLALFEAIITQGLDPGDLLAYLDDVIGRYTGTVLQNCALCYAEILPAANEEKVLRVANAGCMTPIIRRADDTVEWVDVCGIPLGMGLGSQLGYQEISLNLAKGDLLILTSDGLVEANNAADEMFGFKRVEQAVASGPTTGAEAMLDHLKAEAVAFVGQTEPHDDMTIVVVQV